MIAVSALKYLANQNLKDAEVLLANNRNAGAIYLMGYALEFSFKRKISKTLGFVEGFPESAIDLNVYTSQIASFNAIRTGISLTQLKQIKTHDLNKLIIFSGAESGIVGSYYDDWANVKDWNPENRYRKQQVNGAKASEFIISAKQILKQIV